MKQNRTMSQEDAYKILGNGTYGVLSMSSKDGIPYGIPVNYFYVPEENAIFFHCFIKGRKLDYLTENNRVSFTVVGSEKIIQERLITHYDSVVLSGTASLITENEEKTRRLEQLCRILTPAMFGKTDAVIKQHLPAVTIVRIDILELTGKRNRDE